MISIIKNQINLLLSRIITPARHNLNQIDNIWMIQLLQQFDFAHRCDRKALFITIHLYHFERIASFVSIVTNRGLVNFSKGAFSDDRLVLEYLGRAKL